MTRPDRLALEQRALGLLALISVQPLPSVWEMTLEWARRRERVTARHLVLRYLTDLADMLTEDTDGASPAPEPRKEH